MLRHTARLLIVVLSLSSGRLLACGWDCLDELPVTAEASCHHESTSTQTALNGGVAHPCPPDVVQPPVTISQKGCKQFDRAAPETTEVASSSLAPALSVRTSQHAPVASPVSRTRVTTVLRI